MSPMKWCFMIGDCFGGVDVCGEGERERERGVLYILLPSGFPLLGFPSPNLSRAYALSICSFIIVFALDLCQLL